jgi:hypothetical protein
MPTMNAPETRDATPTDGIDVADRWLLYRVVGS